MLAASQDLVSAARLTRKTALRGRDEISPHCGWALALEVRGMRRESRHAYDGEVMDLIFDEFGNVLSESGDTTLLPHGFAGGLYDRDTGLVRFGVRDYDAHAGRWTARDPILFRGGDPNLYAYVNNDPLNRVDLLGTDAWTNQALDALGAFGRGAQAYAEGLGYAAAHEAAKVGLLGADAERHAGQIDLVIGAAAALAHQYPEQAKKLALDYARDNMAFIAGRTTANLVVTRGTRIGMLGGASLATLSAYGTTIAFAQQGVIGLHLLMAHMKDVQGGNCP